MKIELFRAICFVLWGPSWQTPAAEALGVALRTVQRWHAEVQPVPDLGDDLRALIRARRVDLAGLLKRL